MSDFLSKLNEIDTEGLFLVIVGVGLFVYNIYHTPDGSTTRERRKIEALGVKGTKIFDGILALGAVIIGILVIFQ